MCIFFQSKGPPPYSILPARLRNRPIPQRHALQDRPPALRIAAIRRPPPDRRFPVQEHSPPPLLREEAKKERKLGRRRAAGRKSTAAESGPAVGQGTTEQSGSDRTQPRNGVTARERQTKGWLFVCLVVPRSCRRDLSERSSEGSGRRAASPPHRSFRLLGKPSRTVSEHSAPGQDRALRSGETKAEEEF